MRYTYDDIEQYINGQMPSDAQRQFEEELQKDAALQEAYHTYKLLLTTLRKQANAADKVPALENILQPLTQQYFQQSQQKAKVFNLKRSLYMLAAAASIAIILLVVFPDSQLGDYPVDAMSGAVVRGGETNWAKAAQQFNAQNYAAAAVLLQAEKAKNPNDATVNYFLGICLIKGKKYQEALPLFEQLVNGTSVYREDAGFFAALSAYHLRQKEKALLYAQQVKESSRYYQYARTIEKKLR